MTTPYVEPELDKKAFNCPFCNAYANFSWTTARAEQWVLPYKVAQCAHCEKWTVWTIRAESLGDRGSVFIVGNLVYPSKLISPLAHPDLPESCKSEYEE